MSRQLSFIMNIINRPLSNQELQVLEDMISGGKTDLTEKTSNICAYFNVEDKRMDIYNALNAHQ